MFPQTRLEDRSADAPLIDAQRRSTELDDAFLLDPGRFRVLTGDRPTGRLHLGHYFGTLLNRVRLQNLGVPRSCWWPITRRSPIETAPRRCPRDVEELLADYLAVGIDPERTTIFWHPRCRN